jgi:para-nitrobenzyl esterase
MRFKINGINQALTFATLILLLTMIGCGGGGGGSGNSTANTTQTGVFLDSPVSGLGYETRTHQGITGTGGAFSYQDGETVHFFIGDIVLCQVEAMPIITPIDCVEGAVDETHPMVTNMLLFLQSIDFDNDPENGIDIAELLHHEAMGMHLDFAVHPEQFRESHDFRYFLDLMSTRGFFYDFEDRFPPEIEQARTHMRATMVEYGLYGYGQGGPNWGNTPPYSGNDGQQPVYNMGPGMNGGNMGRGPYSGN